MPRNGATSSSSRLRRLLFPIVVVLLFTTTFAQAQIAIKVNDNINFRFGTLIQSWLDELQDASTREYAQNLYLRRVRFLITGQAAPNVTFYFQTDNPNLGKTPKALGSGFLFQDAWVEWKLRDEFMLDGGEFIVPMNRIELVSSAACITVDISPTANLFSTPTQSNGNRDTGIEAKGYLADGRLEYRAALFQGIRNAATSTTTASSNAFRRSGYLQYDFWEKERGYTYPGTSLGKKKILVVAGGYDGQKDYKSYSGNFSAQVPMSGNEFATQLQAVHYDGGTFIKTIPRQNDFLGEFAYYIAAAKFQPYAKIEEQNFATTVSAATTDQRRYGFGANYYVAGQNLKFTGQFLHVIPKSSAIRSTNELTVQMQIWYY
jgi:hypothetical protein